MGPKEWGSISGQIIKQRFIDSYNENPNHCLFCGEVIHLDGKQKPSATKRKKFCNHSCAAQYNNPRRAKLHTCHKCGSEVGTTGKYQRKYCDKCLLEVQQHHGYTNNGISPDEGLYNLTKAEVRAKSKDSTRLRIRITNQARKIYKRSGKPYICLACGYTLHVDICHVKDIKDFSEEALISEINHIDNLITLCPTHHWEFDHGFWHLPKD